MASQEPGDYFNTYYLDTLERNWKFLGKDTAGRSTAWKDELDQLLRNSDTSQVLQYLADQLKKAEADLLKLEKQKPVLPRTASKGAKLFRINVDSAEFPEVAVFDSVKFEVDTRDKNFDERKAQKIWRSVKLERIEGTHDYSITFTDWTEKYNVKAWPVLEGKNLQKAKLEFDKNYSNYAKTVKSKEQEKKDRISQLRSLNDQYSGQVDFDNRDMKLLQQWAMQVNASTEIVFRVFYADKFGIYNCDCPKMLPVGREVFAKFNDSDGKPLKLDKVYLVEKGKNALFTYYENKFSDFRYDPVKTNMIWTVTLDGRIAIIDAKDFKKVKPVHDTCVYVLSVAKEMVKNEEDARKLLDM